MKWKSILYFPALCLLFIDLSAQLPFDCNGRIYRVIEEQGGTTFQELNVVPGSNKLETLDLHFFDKVRINGIAYHPTQHLIYGVLLGKNYRLCRIDADHQLEIIRDLPLPDHLLFVSGDVSPDERYLVLLGYSPDEPTNLAALIDLTDPAFPTTIIPLQTTSPEFKKIYCADIAFHPTTNQLFGFDDLSERLVSIDLDERLIDNTSYPPAVNLRGNVPSIFFDARGELYGIGAPENGYAKRRSFYHFNVDDGRISLRDHLSFEGNQDACSCPFQVKLLNQVSSRNNNTCTDLEFEFTLINRSPEVQHQLSFRDTFPSYLTIRHIDPLPFSGQIMSGVGTNILDIQNLELPVGIFRFSVKVEINRDAPHTTVFNSAYLDGVKLNDPSEGVLIHSDDPETPRPDDPTHFAIEALAVKFPEAEVFICPDSSVEIRPAVSPDADHLWSTGERTASIRVQSPDTYRVTVSSGCEEAEGEIRVSLSRIAVDLGEEWLLERGQQLELQADVNSSSAVRSFLWSASEAVELACTNCERSLVRPRSDAEVAVQVINEDGCPASDLIRLKVTDFGLYAPNAFSPNGDQVNDVFFLSSRQDYSIRQFRVFDRWGSMVFKAPEGRTNHPQTGWDGKNRGQMMRAGVYIWTAELVNLAGRAVRVSGEVSLIR